MESENISMCIEEIIEKDTDNKSKNKSTNLSKEIFIEGTSLIALILTIILISFIFPKVGIMGLSAMKNSLELIELFIGVLINSIEQIKVAIEDKDIINITVFIKIVLGSYLYVAVKKYFYRF